MKRRLSSLESGVHRLEADSATDEWWALQHIRGWGSQFRDSLPADERISLLNAARVVFELRGAEDVGSVAERTVSEALLADYETAEAEYVGRRVDVFVAAMDPSARRHWRRLFAAVGG
jgi:hypothetical protein